MSTPPRPAALVQATVSQSDAAFAGNAAEPAPTHVTRDPARSDFRALSSEELITRCARGVESFDRRVLKLDDAALDTAFLPEAGVGRWPCRVLLGHIADCEVLYVHRIRRAFSEDAPVLALWDEHAAIDSGIYGTPKTGAKHPIAGFIAVVHTLRQWHSGWLRTLSERDWARRALHPERGELTIRTMTEDLVWHLEHHAFYLNLKVERLSGRPAAR